MTKFNGFHDWRHGTYTGFTVCLDCTDRYEACQDTCERVANVKKERAEISKIKQADAQARRCRNIKQFP